MLLLYQTMLYTEFEHQRVLEENREVFSNNEYRLANNSWVEYWTSHYEYYQETGQPKVAMYTPQRIEFELQWYQHEKRLADNLHAALSDHDLSAYTSTMAEKSMLDWTIQKILREGQSKYFSPLASPEEYFGDSWNQFQPLIEIPQFKTLPFWFFSSGRGVMGPEQAVMTTSYYLNLLKDNQQPKGQYDTSPWGFLFNFLRRGLPNVLGLIVALMTVNLLHRDKKYGAIKSALQVPKNRSRYLLRKIALGFTASFLVVLIPLLIMFTIQGFQQGLSGLNYPVLIDNGFFKWSVQPDHAQFTLSGTPQLHWGLSQYQLPWSVYISGLARLSVIPLWQFLGLTLGFLAVYILFCSVVGVFISTFIKNELFAQIAAVGTFVLGAVFGNIFPKLSTTPWDLFANARVISLLEGGHYTTFLRSLVVLAIASAVVFVLSTLIFKKQDIVTE